MSISSGYDKFKDYHQTEDGSYKLTSRWTSSNTVELDDGSTAEEKFAEIDNKFKNQDNSINNINTRLNGLVDNNGRFRQIVMVDAVTGTDYVLEIRNGEWVSYISVPGLYDEDGNLVASWDELVNDYGLNVETNYTSLNYQTSPSSSYYILNNNSELADGTKLIIGDSVTSIGEYAFGKCNGLTNVVIPDSVTSISSSAFIVCKSLTSVTIPDSVTSIGLGAFEGCTSLMSVAIPDSITSIDTRIFSGCTSLTSVVIPDSVTSIGTRAFINCTSLMSVSIPDSVTTIDYEAFRECTSLTSITIPDSVTSIGGSAFDGCTNLTSVYFEHTTAPKFASLCFKKKSGNTCTFYFKNSTVANAFTTSYYNSSYGTKSTNYNW